MTTTDVVLPEAEPVLTPPSAPVERRNPLQLVLGIIIKPRSTFAYIRDHGGWAWVVPLALLVVLTLVSRAVMVPIETAQMEAAIAAMQEQIENNGGGANGEGPGANFVIGGPMSAGSFDGTVQEPNPASEAFFKYGLPVVQALGGWLVCAVLLLVLAWVFGGRPSPAAMFRMSAWAAVPFVVRLVIVTTVMLITQRIPAQGISQAFQAPVVSMETAEGGEETGAGPSMQIVTIGPGGGPMSFTGPSFGDLFVNNLLSNLDIYTVWATLLLGVGVVVTAQVSWIKGALITVLYSALALCLLTLPPLLSFALGGLMGGGPGPAVRMP